MTSTATLNLLNKLGLILVFVTCAWAGDLSWWQADLPSAAINITSTGNRFWVCGVDELVAFSDDGGHKWNVVHRVPNGSVALSVSFTHEKLGVVAGTGGLLLLTTDEGEHWTNLSPDRRSWLMASFGDSEHGIGLSKRGLAFTSNGGKTWNSIEPTTFAEELSRFKTVMGLAMLDSNRAAILVKEGPYSDQRFMSSSDGGKNWLSAELPHTGINSLVAVNGKFWAMGFEVIDREHRGGHSVPATFYSDDAIRWTDGPTLADVPMHCNPAGCLVSETDVAIPWSGKVDYKSFSPAGKLTHRWAAVGTTVCTISRAVLCGNTTSASTIVKATAKLPSLEGLQLTTGGDCILCPSWPRMMESKTASGLINVDVVMTVGANGIVRFVRVAKASDQEIAQAVSETIRGWIFEPLEDQSGRERVSEIQAQVIAIKP